MGLSEIENLRRESQKEKVTALDLSFKKLTSFPTEITELRNLTTLNLSGNQLTSLPPEISELKNLTVLNISRNQLTSLPSEISEFENLVVLDISGNQLTSLPPEISKLRYLTELYIFDNQLTSLPAEISELKNLTKLKVAGNKLTSLPPEISRLENLSELDVYGNKLASLQPEISELKKLAVLDASSNQLTSLPPEISDLKNLTELYIYNNQLKSLPPELSELKNLTGLYVNDNQLISLPPEILEFDLKIEWEYKSGFKGIYLRNNPFETPPVEIIKQGREAIANYFRSLEDEQKLLNEVKVLLVGDGGAGKTSLVKRIFGEGIDGKEPQTQGINIRKWVVENGEREIKANFWDFGGQEIMHSTHQFFLSKRSLYILVLDGRKDEKPEYWLKLIENFGRDSPVLVVINKIDENPSFELNRKFLQKKYPTIKDFYRLSCKSKEGIEEFSKTLHEELITVKHLEIKWPKSWFNVKSSLEKICPNCAHDNEDDDSFEYCNFIEYKEYELMCIQEGIKSKSEQNTLVDFLHDLGIILHFRDIPLLNTHVLEPEWVTNAIYKIVNSKEIAESRGVLKLDILPEVLRQRKGSDFYYPPDQYNFIINLMKKFELSYDLDARTMLLPGLLEIQEPNFDFDYEKALKFIIDYDFLPPSVMPRFIVKMNEGIKDDLRWRTGVVLEDKGFNSTAVVRADNEAKRISIYISGKQKRDYLAIILQRFREINNSFEKLKYLEKIPLPDEPEIAVSYEHLINLELMGYETYIPEGSYNEYKVSDLLGTVYNKNSLLEMVEQILRNTERNHNNYLEILNALRQLQEIDTGYDTEETLLGKIANVVEVNPSLFGVTIKLNEVVKLYLKWRRKS